MRAKESWKSMERRPLEPNQYLKHVKGVKGAICAAEMSDRAQVFNHLVNTSLVTAPMFVNFDQNALNPY